MLQKLITPSLILSLSLIFLMLSLGITSTHIELLFEFNRDKVLQGEYWRILTSNIVHYGVFHLIMNMAAFIIIGVSLLRDMPLLAYAILLIMCAMAVTGGVFVLNPELSFYRGFSGVLHGLIIAGLFFNSFRNRWLSYIGVAIVFAKIIHEHQSDYHETQLQELLPVAVAYDAHLYGAVAGLLFGVSYLIIEQLKKAKR